MGVLVKATLRARRLVYLSAFLAGWWLPGVASAAILETSSSVYDFAGVSAERFRKLPDPEVVLPIPALFDPAVGGSILCELSARNGGKAVKKARG